MAGRSMPPDSAPALPRRNPAATVTSVAVIGAVIFGLFVDFVPMPMLYGWHAAVFFLAVGVVEMVLLGSYTIRKGTYGVFFDKGFVKFVLVFLALPLMFALCSWLIVAKTLPWAFTRAFGEPYRQSYIMRTEYRSSRKSCDYRLQGPPADRSFPGYLCIGEAIYSTYPERSVEVVLSGRRSAFGQDVQSIRVVRPL